VERLRGIIAAAATPVREDLTIDLDRLVQHCGWLLGSGCDGINLLGTTGEATSFAVEERLAAMHAVARSSLPVARFMVGTGAAALHDAVRLTSAARDLGFAGALLLPPFYYKGISNEGLIDYVTTVVERVGDGLRLYLYHFPQNSGVPYPLEVIKRLKERFPDRLIGLKDSSGDLGFSTQVVREVEGLDVFPSAEGAIGLAGDHGYSGCISATANVTAPLARAAWTQPQSPEGREGLSKAVALRQALSGSNLIASVKWSLARLHRDPSWIRVMPPLTALSETQVSALEAVLARTAFPELMSRCV
jgi:4-hydroxy-tetrahydrodipicolinate synthase